MRVPHDAIKLDLDAGPLLFAQVVVRSRVDRDNYSGKGGYRLSLQTRTRISHQRCAVATAQMRARQK